MCFLSLLCVQKYYWMILWFFCSLIKLCKTCQYKFYVCHIYPINFLICMRGQRIHTAMHSECRTEVWNMLGLFAFWAILCPVSWRSVIHCQGWNVNKNWDDMRRWHHDICHVCICVCSLISFSAQHYQYDLRLRIIAVFTCHTVSGEICSRKRFLRETYNFCEFRREEVLQFSI